MMMLFGMRSLELLKSMSQIQEKKEGFNSHREITNEGLIGSNEDVIF